MKNLWVIELEGGVGGISERELAQQNHSFRLVEPLYIKWTINIVLAGNGGLN